MIKANELRIGNLILFKEYGQGEGKIGRIKPGDFGKVVGDDPNNSEYHPIPITLEWLERCSAKEQDYYYMLSDRIGLKKNLYRDASGNYDGFLLSYKVGIEMKSLIGIPTIRFIHRLQNIFADLTGEELTIKEPA